MLFEIIYMSFGVTVLVTPNEIHFTSLFQRSFHAFLFEDHSWGNESISSYINYQEISHKMVLCGAH